MLVLSFDLCRNAKSPGRGPLIEFMVTSAQQVFPKTEKAAIEGFRANKKWCLPLSWRAYKKSNYTNQGNKSLHFSLNGGVIKRLCTEIFGRFQNKERIRESQQKGNLC